MVSVRKGDIITALQTDILRLQGYKSAESCGVEIDLGPINLAFPDKSFPIAAIHEFIASDHESTAATSGFVNGVLSTLMGDHGNLLWISTHRKTFPPSLVSFGINPERVIFIDLKKEQHALWATEEALKCGALSAVVSEMRDISFTASRRLQLAVEESKVTGFILRSTTNPGTTACISRWKITSIPSIGIDDLPGIGHPAWRVELLRMRNGKPGSWSLKWINGQFQAFHENAAFSENHMDLMISRELNTKTG